MERTFKHRITNKTIIIGGQTGESMQKLISSKASDITIQDIVVNSSDWEEIIDKNPLKLEVGKEYILQYVHSKSKPQHIKITQFTEQGYPWQERVRDGGCRGIVSPGCYRLIEEVIEKDYEILSLKCLEDNEIFYNNNNIYKFLFNELEYNLKNGYVIHSIKRLSDSEVFTVGDKDEDGDKYVKIKLYTHTNDNIKNKQVWLSINDEIGVDLHSAKKYKKPIFKTFDNVDIYEGDDLFWLCKKTNSIGKYIWNDFDSSLNDDKWLWFSTKQTAQDYINSKKVLFTTEDGVDIKEGDIVHLVNTEFYYVDNFPANKNTCSTKVSLERGIIRFSTKEAAENFIILNKPCLSLNDVGQFYKKLLDFSNGNSKGLLELVKSKL